MRLDTLPGLQKSRLPDGASGSTDAQSPPEQSQAGSPGQSVQRCELIENHPDEPQTLAAVEVNIKTGMRIDAHQHFWDVSKLDYPWMPPGDSVLRRNYLPEDLAPVLEQNHFDGTVVVQANVVMEETWWLLDLASRHDPILGVVAWVDLTDRRLGETLDRCGQHPKFKGVRHIVHDEPDVRWLLRRDVLRGLRELAARDIPYDLLLRPPHLPMIPELAGEVPGLRMVIDHIAKPPIAEHRMEPWAQDMEIVARIPGMHCKLSGMITEADHGSWSAQDLTPYVQLVLKLFPPERLMFGSDWPVCKLAGSWKQVLAAFTQACGPLPQIERNKILGETAQNFYRLTPAAHSDVDQ